MDRRPCLRRMLQRQRRPRARAQSNLRVVPRRPHHCHEILPHMVRHSHLFHYFPCPFDIRSICNHIHRYRSVAGLESLKHHRLLLVRRIPDRQLQQEAVQLRLRQHERALHLHRIQRRQNQKRRTQTHRCSVDRNLLLLHRLQQRRLRPRRRPIDLIRQQNLREDRTLFELERPQAGIVDIHSQHIRRHQIRRELDPIEVQPQRSRNRLRQRRLPRPRHILEQHMTTTEHRDDRKIYRITLTNEDPLHILPNLPGEILHERSIDVRFRRLPKYFCGLSQENLDI